MKIRCKQTGVVWTEVLSASFTTYNQLGQQDLIHVFRNHEGKEIAMAIFSGFYSKYETVA